MMAAEFVSLSTACVQQCSTSFVFQRADRGVFSFIVRRLVIL
jgi:hypothetical protein